MVELAGVLSTMPSLVIRFTRWYFFLNTWTVFGKLFHPIMLLIQSWVLPGFDFIQHLIYFVMRQTFF